MREAELENWVRIRIRDIGGLCIKFTSPSMRGVPDRLVLLPGGKILFLELKRPGETARPEQRKVHRRFKALGAGVFVVDSKEKLEEILRDAL